MRCNHREVKSFISLRVKAQLMVNFPLLSVKLIVGKNHSENEKTIRDRDCLTLPFLPAYR